MYTFESYCILRCGTTAARRKKKKNSTRFPPVVLSKRGGISSGNASDIRPRTSAVTSALGMRDTRSDDFRPYSTKRCGAEFLRGYSGPNENTAVQGRRFWEQAKFSLQTVCNEEFLLISIVKPFFCRIKLTLYHPLPSAPPPPQFEHRVTLLAIPS